MDRGVGPALRDAEMAKDREVLDQRWRSQLAALIRDGQSGGEFAASTEDATELALRLQTLIDGLAIQVIMNDSEVSPERMHRTCMEVSAQQPVRARAVEELPRRVRRLDRAGADDLTREDPISGPSRSDPSGAGQARGEPLDLGRGARRSAQAYVRELRLGGGAEARARDDTTARILSLAASERLDDLVPGHRPGLFGNLVVRLRQTASGSSGSGVSSASRLDPSGGVVGR